jgi:hypothetical protein
MHSNSRSQLISVQFWGKEDNLGCYYGIAVGTYVNSEALELRDNIEAIEETQQIRPEELFVRKHNGAGSDLDKEGLSSFAVLTLAVSHSNISAL